MNDIDYTTAKYIHETYIKPFDARIASQSKRFVRLEAQQDEQEKTLSELSYEFKTLRADINRWSKAATYFAVGFVLPALATLLVLGFKAWIKQQ